MQENFTPYTYLESCQPTLLEKGGGRREHVETIAGALFGLWCGSSSFITGTA